MSEITAIKGAVKAAKAASKASDGFKLHVYKGKSFLLPDYLTDEQVKFILWKKVDAPQQAGREEKIDLPSELPEDRRQYLERDMTITPPRK